jgi:hypothetical protein
MIMDCVNARVRKCVVYAHFRVQLWEGGKGSDWRGGRGEMGVRGGGRGGRTVLIPPGLFRYGPNPVCVHLCMYMCVRTCKCVCVFVFLCARVCSCGLVCMYVYVRVCACVYVCVSMILFLGTERYNLEHDSISWLHHGPDGNCNFLFYL